MVHVKARTVERMETRIRGACPREWRGYVATIRRTTNPTDVVHGAIYLFQKEKIPVLSTYHYQEPE